jgi:hypothetical protein
MLRPKASSRVLSIVAPAPSFLVLAFSATYAPLFNHIKTVIDGRGIEEQSTKKGRIRKLP